MLVHLDTDLAGDPDDVAALVYLLARDDVELTGITTVDDPGGRRAGYVAEVLRLAGRQDVPLAAGAEVSLTTRQPSGGPPPGPPYWPAVAAARPGPVDAALDLLAASVSAGAVVVGIGPATTLALLERRTPGALRTAHVVLMGGWVDPPGPGLPQWGPEDDWNVTCDVVAATEVRAAAGRLTVVPLSVTAQVHLRDRDLPRLRAAGGALGRLMAAQAEAYRDDEGKTALARANPGLPDDLANFHHDPFAAAVAAGWDGVTMELTFLRTVVGEHGRLERAAPHDPGARRVELVVGVDGPAFAAHWLETVTADCRTHP
jgi:inosine-uridine nucleoside N-ribohydrolase